MTLWTPSPDKRLARSPCCKYTHFTGFSEKSPEQFVSLLVSISPGTYTQVHPHNTCCIAAAFTENSFTETLGLDSDERKIQKEKKWCSEKDRGFF